MGAVKEWLLFAVLVIVAIGLGYLGITNLALAEQQPDFGRWAIAFVLILVAAFIGAAFVAAAMEFLPVLRRIGEDGRAWVAIVLWLVIGIGTVYAVHDTATAPLRHVEAALAPVCAGGAVPEAGQLSNGGTQPNHLVVLDETGQEHPWSFYVDLAWRPGDVADAELVACAPRDDTAAVTEVCTYRGGPNVTRYAVSREIRIMAARTGQQVAAFTISHNPRACAQTEDRSLTELRGDPVSWSDVAARLKGLDLAGS